MDTLERYTEQYEAQTARASRQGLARRVILSERRASRLAEKSENRTNGHKRAEARKAKWQSRYDAARSFPGLI